MKTAFEPEEINQLSEIVADKVFNRVASLLSTINKGVNEIVDINELSQKLKVKKSLIYSWVYQSKNGLNEFPFSKAGNKLRFVVGEVLDWMKQNGK
jgi:predicted DNA-binding transcriptional regulator AlpA